MRGEVRAGRREGVGRRRRKRHARGGPGSRREGQGTRGAHPKHADHARSLGGVEAQRLVERRRLLPSQREGHATGARCGPGGGRAWGSGGASGMHGEGPIKAFGGARARAGRTWNIPRMIVALEVSRLSGWLNAEATCRVKGRGMQSCGARCGPGGRRGREAAVAQAASTGKAWLKAWRSQGMRGAHLEHAFYIGDLGGVEAQRLVERPRDLPSRREGHAMRGEVRIGRREGVRRWRRKRQQGRPATQGFWGPGHARSARRTCTSCL